jgi:hypothetical protein
MAPGICLETRLKIKARVVPLLQATPFDSLYCAVATDAPAMRVSALKNSLFTYRYT